jgi:aerobic carbon-monoxide dehydrogenase medium subunit
MSFELHQPASLDEALHLVTELGDDAIVVAGGTAVAVLSKLRLIRPAHVVSLRRIEELSGIAAADDGSTRLGALTTLRSVERSRVVRARCGALADACGAVATVRIREQATVGGNVVHADPAQDPPPMLIALGATALVAGSKGRRSAPLDGFFTDWFTVALEPGELLLGVGVPAIAADARTTYLKFLPRTAEDYATVSVAALARLDADGRVVEARVVLGAVGPTPIRAHAVERAIVGAAPTARAIDEAAAMVRDEVHPIDDGRGSARYKREMARVWTARALREVTM